MTQDAKIIKSKRKTQAMNLRFCFYSVCGLRSLTRPIKWVGVFV